MKDLNVKSARYLRDYVLEIEFTDGKKKEVDFQRFIFSDNHPVYDKYKDVEEFKKFEIVYDNVSWDDYTMVFPVEDLYNNTV